MFIPSSKRKNQEIGVYETIDAGKIKEIPHKSNAFIIVAQKPKRQGIKNPSVFRILLKIPPKKPKRVRKRQFNPNGPAVKKSKQNPEINPVVSPKSLPF